jgi:O-antigen/teichoic acid export membrane protein
MVASILSASIAQLPFFAAISVMARFAMAKRYERDVLASSVLSIILFVIVAVTGTNKFGIVAIGVAASIGMAGGAAFLSWSLYARCDIPKYVHESFILLSVGYGLVIGSVAGGQIFITCIFMIMWALMASRAWRRSLGDRGGEQQCAV